MKSEECTDYKKSTPEVIYEAKKIVIKMWKKGSFHKGNRRDFVFSASIGGKI